MGTAQPANPKPSPPVPCLCSIFHDRIRCGGFSFSARLGGAGRLHGTPSGLGDAASPTTSHMHSDVQSGSDAWEAVGVGAGMTHEHMRARARASAPVDALCVLGCLSEAACDYGTRHARAHTAWAPRPASKNVSVRAVRRRCTSTTSSLAHNKTVSSVQTGPQPLGSQWVVSGVLESRKVILCELHVV